jgi:hypothetical protein
MSARDPIPHLPSAPPLALSLSTLPTARDLLSTQDFRLRLRKTLLDRPNLTLATVARALGVTRQYVGALVGRLDRPTCARHDKPGPKRDQALSHIKELTARVARGESAEAAARALGISLPAAAKLGFRTKAIRPSHGTWDRAKQGCGCWRCRRAAGIALPRGPKSGVATRAEVEDWLAWADPYDGTQLTQATIGRLAGTHQGAVSRIARSAE